jgi:hypothetical protein
MTATQTRVTEQLVLIIFQIQEYGTPQAFLVDNGATSIAHWILLVPRKCQDDFDTRLGRWVQHVNLIILSKSGHQIFIMRIGKI